MRRHWIVLTALILAGALPPLIVVCGLTGCEVGSVGLFRPMSQQAYTATTNAIVTAAAQAAQYAGFPWATAIDALQVLALAGLAAWQAVTTRKITALNGAVTSAKNKDTS